MDTIAISVFKVESEAYQALSKMKNHTAYQESLKFSHVVLVKKSNDRIHGKDGFDTGKITRDDTWKAGLLGGLVGILGGPLGILLGWGVGTLAGVAKDSYDARGEIGIVKYISSRMEEGDVATIAVMKEENPDLYDRMIAEFDAETVRFERDTVEKEIEHAKEVEKKLQKQAEDEM